MPEVRGVAAVAAALTTSAIVATACTGDEAGDRPDDTLPVVETVSDLLIEATAPPRTLPAGGAEFVEEALADDVVTDDELDEAYQRFVDCLADGGGAGRYAFDVELRIPLSLDWSLEDSNTGELSADGLTISCSRDHLGDLVDRYEEGNPTPDDLADQQLANVRACVERVSPRAAANLPDEVTLDTAGPLPYIEDLQLGGVIVGVAEEHIGPVNDCIDALGAEWRAFG